MPGRAGTRSMNQARSPSAPVRDLDRDPGLADAAGPDQRHEPGRAEGPLHLVDHLGATHERADRLG